MSEETPVAAATILAPAGDEPADAPVEDAASTEVSRLRAGDAATWAMAFERDHPVVFRYVYARTGNRAAAEDIASQVFLEAFQGIGRYRERGRPLLA